MPLRVIVINQRSETLVTVTFLARYSEVNSGPVKVWVIHPTTDRWFVEISHLAAMDTTSDEPVILN